ncbi:MAG TPA: biotin--[acetyl-CoA-carboxylase] ligase [Polyangiaceae bacterium]|nr:biotin--[acetyl-CoA-carboxylase] ligase [Polyangiaceae bacterium]
MIRRVGADLERARTLVAELGCGLGHPMTIVATTVSTNDDASRGAREGAPHGATWVAEDQTAGRGRRGRSWLAVPGECVLASVLLRVACSPQRLPQIALLAGLAVRDAVARASGADDVRIKWPNDVVVADRKLAGVLVEGATVGARVEAVVVGVGINVHARSFPDEIADRATSVALVTRGDPPDRAVVLAHFLASLDRDLHVVVSRGLGLLRARLEAADALAGRRVRSEAGDEGIAAGIDDDGRLMVRRDGGVIARLGAGEVFLVRT